MRNRNDTAGVQQYAACGRDMRSGMNWQNILWSEMLSPQVYDRTLYFSLPVCYPNRKGGEHVG